MAQPSPPRSTLRANWIQRLEAKPRGLALAREKHWVLAWDEQNWLSLFNRRGEVQARTPAPGRLGTACCSDDGSVYAAVGHAGEVWWLAPDLAPRWRQMLPGRAVSAALDPLGQYLAVGDTTGRVQVFDRHGRTVSKTTLPRALHHLAFVPEAAVIVGSGDFGLVVGLDLGGKTLWRDGLVAHCGGLTVSGDGANVVLACFSDGLRCYTSGGQNRGRLPFAEPVRLVALSYDGALLLVAGLGEQLRLVEREGRTVQALSLDQPVTALALAPLAEYAVTALADGRVLCFDPRA